MRRSLAGVAVAAILVLTLGGTGCASCDQEGCSSGAFVQLSPSPKAKSGAVVARVCIGSKCRRFELAGGTEFLEVDVPDLDPDDSVDVSVSLRDSRDAVLRRGSGRFAPRTRQPNGSDCPPTCHVLSLSFDARKATLTAVQR